MPLLKRLFVAMVSAVATLTPVSAEIQDGTASLLKTIEDNGILVTYNHPACDHNGSHGQYRWVGFQREMRLCPGDSIDAIDHNVVRHEVIHAIQHCVNTARGTHLDTAVIADPEDFREFIVDNLTEYQIERILEVYPEDQWPTELEAFAGANAYTASRIEELFLQACVAPNAGIQ